MRIGKLEVVWRVPLELFVDRQLFIGWDRRVVPSKTKELWFVYYRWSWSWSFNWLPTFSWYHRFAFAMDSGHPKNKKE